MRVKQGQPEQISMRNAHALILVKDNRSVSHLPGQAALKVDVWFEMGDCSFLAQYPNFQISNPKMALVDENMMGKNFLTSITAQDTYIYTQESRAN